MATRLSLSIAVLAASLCAGCASTEALRGLPPFFELDSERATDVTDVVVRPLFRWRDDPRRKDGADVEPRLDVNYLFPLGKYKRKGDDVEHHLYPLFQWIRRTQPDGFVNYDYLFFPFVWGGDQPGEGKYFTLWPFGGNLRSLFGLDHVVHVLFPLFLYTRLHEAEGWHLAWPLLAYYRGGGSFGFRVMPLFGMHKKERDGRLLYERYSVLFPFFAWERDNLNSKNPFTAWAIFPIYGQTRSRMVDETTVLWPFFRKRDEKVDGITRWRLPFPIVMLAFGNETQRDFWPLFGYRNNGGFTRWFAIWPIFRSEVHDQKDEHVSRFWVAPFFWRHARTLKATGATIRAQTKLWPLVRVDRTREGAFGFRAPSPLWFNDGPEGDFEQILTPMLELVRYTRDPARGRELRLLFSIFRASWGPGAEEDGWSVFGGLFGHRTTREGDGRVRLFWFIEV